MHTRFFRALSVTIRKILSINYFAHIVTHRTCIVSAISCIVSAILRTVRPKLADTKFCRSFVTMTPFYCVIMGEFLFSRKLFANDDCHLRTDIHHLRTDIQVELPHFSNRDLYLLTVRTLYDNARKNMKGCFYWRSQCAHCNVIESPLRNRSGCMQQMRQW